MKLSINVEPIIFLVGFVIGVYYMVLSQFVFRKQCLMLFVNTIDDPDQLTTFCRQLHINANDSKSAKEEEDTSRISIYLVIIYSIPGAIMTIIMGACSDVHGRKPVLVISLVGQTLAMVPAIVSANDMHSSMIWLMASYSLCGILSGGVLTTMGLSFAMIADSATNDSSRTIKLGIGSGLITIGVVTGNVVCGYVLARWDSFVILFLIGQSTMVLAVVYCVCVMNETANRDRLKTTLSIGNVYRSLLVVSRQRLDGRRRRLICYLMAFLIFFATDLGSSTGLFILFVKGPPFFWVDSHISYYISVAAALSAIATVVLLFAYRWMKLPERTIIAFSVLVNIIRWVFMALSPSDIYLYIGKIKMKLLYLVSAVAISLLSTPIYPTLRSMIASQVDECERGKVFCLIALIESLTPIVSALVFVRFYTWTVVMMPGLVFIVASVIQFVVIFIMIGVHILDNRSNNTNFIDDQQCIINGDDDDAPVDDNNISASD